MEDHHNLRSFKQRLDDLLTEERNALSEMEVSMHEARRRAQQAAQDHAECERKLLELREGIAAATKRREASAQSKCETRKRLDTVRSEVLETLQRARHLGIEVSVLNALELLIRNIGAE